MNQAIRTLLVQTIFVKEDPKRVVVGELDDGDLAALRRDDPFMYHSVAKSLARGGQAAVSRETRLSTERHPDLSLLDILEGRGLEIDVPADTVRRDRPVDEPRAKRRTAERRPDPSDDPVTYRSVAKSLALEGHAAVSRETRPSTERHPDLSLLDVLGGRGIEADDPVDAVRRDRPVDEPRAKRRSAERRPDPSPTEIVALTDGGLEDDVPVDPIRRERSVDAPRAKRQ